MPFGLHVGASLPPVGKVFGAGGLPSKTNVPLMVPQPVPVSAGSSAAVSVAASATCLAELSDNVRLRKRKLRTVLGAARNHE